jgi:hypothetical protein
MYLEHKRYMKNFIIIKNQDLTTKVWTIFIVQRMWMELSEETVFQETSQGISRSLIPKM